MPQAENLLPPCQEACPLQQGVRDYLFAIATGDFNRALEIIKETNPLPSICATICAHHCEDKCRRGDVDSAVSIRGLKRAAVENGQAKTASLSSASPKGKIAVIGGGPSGLTAACDLARQGYTVTVFEKEQMMGGALCHYIPLYRLPDRSIEQDTAEIEAQGVGYRYGMELGRNLTIGRLEEEGYRAVLLALGLPVSRGLNIHGVEGEGVLYALPFLKQVKREGFRFQGRPTVIVIGGGNVAMDVARSAVRCGAGKVKLTCLESAGEMPAFSWEIDEAGEEGVEFYCSWGPSALVREAGKLVGLGTVACTAVFDEAGRFNPQFDHECDSFISGDIVIFSIGQGGDPAPLRGEVEVDEHGRIVFNGRTMATSRPGVFACGELVTGPSTAVQAMASGRLAARAMISYLEGGAFDSATLQKSEALEKLNCEVAGKVTCIERHSIPMISPAERVKHFDQAELGYDLPAALAEARRCLSCAAGAVRIDDLCANCLTCVRICPYGVPVINEQGAVSIRTGQCQACGLCLDICPARAIRFRASCVEDAAGAIEPAVRELMGRRATWPAILALSCGYGGFAAPEFTGFRADHAALVRFPCVAKIDTLHLLKALSLGVDGILVVGCAEESEGALLCPYRDSEFWAGKRVGHVRKLLKDLGLEEERVILSGLTGPVSAGFGRILNEATLIFKTLGPSPLR